LHAPAEGAVGYLAPGGGRGRLIGGRGLVGRLVRGLVGRLVRRLVRRLVGGLVARLVRRLVARLVGRLVRGLVRRLRVGRGGGFGLLHRQRIARRAFVARAAEDLAGLLRQLGRHVLHAAGHGDLGKRDVVGGRAVAGDVRGDLGVPAVEPDVGQGDVETVRRGGDPEAALEAEGGRVVGGVVAAGARHEGEGSVAVGRDGAAGGREGALRHAGDVGAVGLLDAPGQLVAGKRGFGRGGGGCADQGGGAEGGGRRHGGGEGGGTAASGGHGRVSPQESVQRVG